MIRIFGAATLIPGSFTEDEVKEFGKTVSMGRTGRPSDFALCHLRLARADSIDLTGPTLHPMAAKSSATDPWAD